MAKHIDAPFDTAAQPQERAVSDTEPRITTLNAGEPEKDFTRPPVSPEPSPRPVPDDAPRVTTMNSGEPEKDFGRPIIRPAVPDLD